jgi:hypothetical protein
MLIYSFSWSHDVRAESREVKVAITTEGGKIWQ